jgi:putative tryptophan/tyrosine transport system substrate-binding protein
MRRRQFITLLGGATAWPVTARAQQSRRVRQIGVLMGTADDSVAKARLAAFRQGLKELNWSEGRDVLISVRWGAGDGAKIGSYAAELAGLAPDVILGTNTPTVRALKQATGTIPIVFAGLADPVGDGAVTNLSKPEGNITGFASFESEIAGKWIQFLKTVSPGIERVAVLYNPDTAPHAIFLPTLERTAQQIGVALVRRPVTDEAAIRGAIGELASAPPGGLVVMPDVFTTRFINLIVELAILSRIPTIGGPDQYARRGCLLAYGSNFNDQFRRAASYVDRILKGEKPGDLPVQNPTKYELIANLKTANAIGIKVPDQLLAIADEVIE